MSHIYKVMVTCLLFVVSLVSAHAAQEPLDYGAMELDKPYAIAAQYQYVDGHYTATQTGVLTVTSTTTDIFTPFSDAAYTQVMSVKKILDNVPHYHVYYTLNVTEGQTIYFRYNGINNGEVTLSFSTNNTLLNTSISPQEGSTVMCTRDSQLSFRFNRSVDAQKVEIVTEKATKSIAFNTNSNSIYFEVKQPIYELMKAGQLAEGDNFSIRISGIHQDGDDSNVYGENGELTAQFVCGAKPVSLVSSTNFSNDHAFRSFWTKGDPDGIVTLTFDGNIKVGNNKVTLLYGDNSSGAEASAKYTEIPPFTVSGNQIIIDLTNKERTPQTMLGISTVYDNILLTVSSVTDEKDNPVYTTSSGSRGTFNRSMPYGIESVNANTQITPANGSILTDDIQAIEIFATDYKKFSFTGAKFAYTDRADNTAKSVTVAKEACTETADGDIEGAYTLSIPVPAEVRGQKDIYLSLNNLKAADGKNYSTLFSAKYNGFTVLDMTYQANKESAPVTLKGAELAELVSDAPIVITTNRDEVTGNDSLSYVTYEITDLNPVEGDDAAIVTKSHIERGEGTTAWVGEMVGANTTKLYTGHTYRVIVTGYQQLAKFFNPYRDIVVGTDTLYFTGTQADYVYSDVQLESITPADYNINSADEFQVTANFDGLVKIVENETGIAGGMMEELQGFDNYTPVDANDEGYASKWIMSMNPETAAELDDRSITINIAATDQDERRVKGNSGNRETTFFSYDFILNYNGALLTVVPTQGGAEGEELDSLYQFDVTAPDVIAIGALDLNEAHVFDMLNTIDVPVVSTTFVYDDAETQEIADYIENVSYEAAVEKYGEEATRKAYLATTNTMRLTLAQPIKQEGGYTLVIPSAYFTSGEQFEGVVNKAYEGFFMVKGAAEPTVLNFTTDPENGSTVESLGEVSILFPDYEEDGVGIGNGMITIKKDGEQIARVDASFDDVLYNKYYIPVNQTAKGIYTIEIPAGYFLDPNGDELPAITLEYGIGCATGIKGISTEQANASAATYTLGGVRVSGKLPAGVYIKGGKKVIVK